MLVAIVSNALRALDSATQDIAQDVQDALEGTTVEQLQLLIRLRLLAGVSAGLNRGGNSATVLAQLPGLFSRLPAAAKLADLLHQWWQPAMQPERHAEAQLALAQAAATRSCAYPRCANLGGEGGPAAGEGVGSMRCRWVG